jgi:group I intron endonuclease
MIIYKAENKTNGKIYIGQTIYSLEYRKIKHLEYARRKGKKTKFANAIRRYGEDGFIWEVIDTASNKDELNEKERKYIAEFKSIELGYNMTDGGGGGDTYSSMSYHRKKRNKELKRINATRKNIMNEKTVYQCWVDSYGKEEADIRMKESIHKRQLTNKLLYERKKEQLIDEYGDIIISKYPDKSLSEIIEEYRGIVPRELVKEILHGKFGKMITNRSRNVGIQNPNSKLTCEQVNEIRILAKTEKRVDLAKRYGVSVGQIFSIIGGRSYKNC